MDDSFAIAEKRGYAKGYKAGRRKLAHEVSREQQIKRENAFWQRVFVAVLPSFLQLDNWTMDGKKVHTLADRVELASRAAGISVDKALHKFKL